MGAVVMAIPRNEQFRLLGYVLDEHIGKISLKNRKLDSDQAIAKELVAMPTYKGLVSLRSMRRYVAEAIERKMEHLECERRSTPGGPIRPVSAFLPIEPEMRPALREMALEAFRYKAARLEFSWKEQWELSPKELDQRAMQRAKRPQG
jgi:hypothetical protein